MGLALDTIIIGAGPSGSRLALGLAERGYEVLVIERKAAPGDGVCCTGIVSRECLDSFDIDRSLVLRSASSAKLVAPSGKWLRLWREGEVACVLDRPAFDRALADRAREAGAGFTLGSQVIEVHVETDRVRVITWDGTTLEAKTVVLASGFGSSLPARLGLGRISDQVIGAQAKVEVSGIDEVEVYIDQNLAPGGFAWLVPTQEGGGLAGLITRRQPELCLNNLLSSLEEQGKIVSAEVETDYAALPLRPLPRTSADRILVVGEVAGQVKPFSGGGIYYGLLCADIAADSLHRAFAFGDFSAAGLSSYIKQWRVILGWELHNSYWLRRLVERLNNQRIESLFDFMSHSDVPGFIAGQQNLSFDRHSPVVRRLLGHLAASAPRTMLARVRRKRDREG
ncbi:NAD(P)/FAD-dependent oxidoreductase [Chloroflexota bacterium]